MTQLRLNIKKKKKNQAYINDHPIANCMRMYENLSEVNERFAVNGQMQPTAEKRRGWPMVDERPAASCE